MVFGPTHGRPHTEEDRSDPKHYVNEYQRTKVLADAECAGASAAGLPVVTVFPTTVYGPSRVAGESPITDVARRFQRARVVPLVGGDDCRRNLVYIDDVVDGLLAAGEAARPGEGYFLGGENVSPCELLDLLGELTGRRVPRLRVPARLAQLIGAAAEAGAAITRRPPPVTRGTIEALYTDWSVSSEKAKQELGYCPTPLREGLRRALELEPEKSMTLC
jgi:nucleoside-diphosphate-sugar epimerase